MRITQHAYSAAAPGEPTIVGASAALGHLRDIASRVANGEAKVLITGESGVGKDAFARLIHARSPRAHQRFVALNCASFSETLLESELFGHVKGSFTGAYRDKVGKLQLAHRGTIFLDEIAEMSLRMQAMLLRFLENGEIQPVGSDTPNHRVDVRVISATNRDLPEMVSKGEFREDLLYRIRVVHLHVPPLRERTEDIRPLIAHVLKRGGYSVKIAEEALACLTQYRWPGNVRELQSVIEQMIAVAARDEIGVNDLPAVITAARHPGISVRRERRRTVSDELYDALVAGSCGFWTHVYPLFTNRDLTRADLRQLMRRGLASTRGNYRAVLQLFGMSHHDYKKLMNFLAAHDCVVNYREFRKFNGGASAEAGAAEPARPTAAIA